MHWLNYTATYNESYENANWMISSSSVSLKSYGFGSLHKKVNLHILQILGATLLKWVSNKQPLKKSNFIFPFWGGGSVAVHSLFIIVAPIVSAWFLLCFAVKCVVSSFAIISLGKRELVALLLLTIGAIWLLVICDSSSRCRGLVWSVWLWYFLVILTYFFKNPPG